MTRMVNGEVVHLCANPACERRTPADRAFCGSCWRRVPRSVQDDIYWSWGSRSIGDHLEFLGAVGERLVAGEGPWPS